MTKRLTDVELEALVQSCEYMGFGHQRDVIHALRELQGLRRGLRGISGCGTCEVCRGAALILLGMN